MSYIGYFKSLQTNNLFSVTIKKTDDISTPKEVTLTGDQPFVVRMEESETAFDGIRTSTATIRLVADQYFEDILPNKAQETEVILKNEDTNTIEWIGYLTPRLYSQGYEKCIEEIELEAADVLSSTQYVDFTTNTGRGFTKFKDLIVNIFDKTGIKGFYWPLTKSYNNNHQLTLILPDMLKISSMNFYTNDTDEPWTEQEILQEMCVYMGMTCVQYKDYIYFVDYTALSNSDSVRYAYYPKAADWVRSSDKMIGQKQTISQEDIYGNGQTISFDPIYNKFAVKDNFYTCEDFISNIFDDEHLINRNGDFYADFIVSPPAYDPDTNSRVSSAPTYPWKSEWFKQKYVKDADDADYVFFHRLYDHKDYESIYRTPSGDTKTPDLDVVNPIDGEKASANITRNYIGGTILDLGVVKKDYINEAQQTVVANKVDWERYLCISQCGYGWDKSSVFSEYLPVGPQDNMTVFRLKPGTYGQVYLGDVKSYLIIDYKLLFTKYKARPYINPEWTDRSFDASSWGPYHMEGWAAGRLAFKLGIGGKYWNGYNWSDTESTFIIDNTREEDEYAYIMKEKEVLNTVSWTLNLGEEGYIIPLEGIDTAGEIDFAIYLPNIQLISDFNHLPPTKYNGYAWIKDLSIKTAVYGQAIESSDEETEEGTGTNQKISENDVVYENVIDTDFVNEMSDIEVKFTTLTEMSKPSYSNVVVEINGNNTALKIVKETGLTGTNQVPEENIIERYYNQYSTPTKKLSYTIDNNYTPFDKFYGVDVDNPDMGYIMLGCEIDYSRDTLEITLLQKK